MKKKADHLNPDEKKYIHIEGIDYSKTGDESIWGLGDKDTLELLRRIDIHGTWLNLAAGDGRYNVNLLKEADVVASDLDESALRKLWVNTPEEYRTKLTINVFDITERFPFKDESFDGVFCASTLHYFPKQVMRKIFGEIDRILKKNGRILVEFATDMNRVLPDGRVYIRESEPLYTFEEAVSFLNRLLNLYEVHITESEVPPEHVKTERFEYTLSCKLIILVAEKH